MQSGLFSASLTAFLIESYKVLQPDSGDLTVAGIAQLSRQLAAIASNTTFVLPPSPTFSPTAGSLWCNALWFISLSLSLTCALLATLVEQWSREFLHKTEMRPSPLRRARVFSFLYFGLKRFRMHTIVDAIPFLLHASLLLFFAGLVAFLLPVNHIMMYLMCIVLFMFLVLYIVLTILPVVRLDCPYRTPLSTPLWSMLQGPFAFFDKSGSSGQRTMTEAVAALALQDTKHRDQRALEWTLASLTDDIELLPFIESIPDIVLGPNGFRRTNDTLFEGLLGTIEVPSPLVTRIYGLVAGTEGMLPEDPLCARRRTAGHQALWALCMMPSAWDRLFDLDHTLFVWAPDGHAASIRLAVMYQAQRWAHSVLGMLCDLLVEHHRSTEWPNKFFPAIQTLIRILITHKDIITSPFGPPTPSNPFLPLFMELEATYHEPQDSTPMTANLDNAQRIVTALHDSHDWAQHSLIFITFFIDTALDGLLIDGYEPPFEPLRTCYSILSEIESNPPKQMVMDSPKGFPRMIGGVGFSRVTPPLADTLARIVFRMLPFFSSCQTRTYLTQRNNAEAIQYALQDCDLTKLAHTLAPRWDPIYHSMNATIDQIMIVASCLGSDSLAIGFVDAVLQVAQGSPDDPDLVHDYPAIEAVRYLRRLKQVNKELFDLHFTSLPRNAWLSRVQELCRQELFYELRPLFLPEEVDIRIVIHSLQTHLANKYISFMSDFFETRIPATAHINLSVFNRFSSVNPYFWSSVKPEIQSRFFVALLAYTKAITAIQPNTPSHVAAIGKELWGSDLFWINWWEGRAPSIETIEPSCLQLLQESLELYHRVGTALTGDRDIVLDMAEPKRLLEEVQKRLSRLALHNVGKDAIIPNVEGILPKPMESQSMLGDDHSGISSENNIQSVRTE
ncbi:hypothetical protein MSAN_02060000 [Mycena sanguinolenta]|uniref:DUF6535 domain-containing protein n=1 Tax=Mycena sanguinolenta TaxID=230812 RepID=A0A8H6XJG2_9AGAR|nr:hypothetical protein MSAN_02060000 [Mycena sanguinolenta]